MEEAPTMESLEAVQKTVNIGGFDVEASVVLNADGSVKEFTEDIDVPITSHFEDSDFDELKALDFFGGGKGSYSPAFGGTEDLSGDSGFLKITKKALNEALSSGVIEIGPESVQDSE